MATQRELNRRSFFNRIAGYAAAGLAVVHLPGCDFGGTSDDDFSNHGPVRTDDKYYRMAKAPAAASLFAPYEHGEPFSRNWAIGAVVIGHQNQMIVVVIDLDTGGQGEFEIYRDAPGPKPLAKSRRYNIHLNDGGRGDQKTPSHLERLASDLADLIGRNEEGVTLDFDLASHREAERMRFGPHEGPGVDLDQDSSRLIEPQE
jgi:hypothetical protein